MKISLNHNKAISSQWFAVKNKGPEMDNSHLKKEKDSIQISGQARQLFSGMKAGNSMIDSLMKQRENLMEMKSNVRERAIESGKDMSSIEEELKTFDQQIAELDAQMAEILQKEREKALGKKSEEEKQMTPKTEEEALLTQAVSLDQTKTMDRVSNSLNREKRTLESQIAQDVKRGVNTEHKKNKVSTIEERLQKTSEQLNEKLQSLQEQKAEEAKEPSVLEKNTKKDKESDHNEYIAVKEQ